MCLSKASVSGRSEGTYPADGRPPIVDHRGIIMALHRILIVEDEIFVAMDIERILVDAGYHVTAIAADRDEALAAAREAEIAFVDLNLRDGPTGPTLARELAEQGILIMYVTANPSQIEMPAPTAIGYIHKPFDEPAILTAAALLSNQDHTYPVSSAVVRFE
jgi:CheY-like chemotaxis protein